MNATTFTDAPRTIKSTGQLVDNFGRTKAQAAELSEQLDDIKAQLIEREGEGKFEGELFRLALSHSLRSSTDWKAIALTLAKKASIGDKAFDNLIAANTSLADCWVARSSARVTK